MKKGVQEWNDWRKLNPKIGPNLEGESFVKAELAGINFSGSRLMKVNFAKANLTGADLSGADLTLMRCRDAKVMKCRFRKAVLDRASFEGADLSKADFTGSFVERTTFRSANLASARFSGAYLTWVDFHGAMIRGINFRKCRILNTVFGDVDLSEAKGLDSINHFGPSTIGMDTIYRSKGKIPEVFLRGAGVPGEFITYMKSLVANPIEFYSCFISYSTANQEFAERLHGDLQNKNVRCWFAPHDVQGGKKLHEQIDEAIRVHEKVLLILSAESMKSEWVNTEIAKARKREVREKKQVLFPVRLVPFEAIRDWECFDADAGKDSAREIREYFIPDFSEWKHHDKYKKAFERLLRDLKAGEGKVKS